MPPVIEVSHLTKEYRLGALHGLKQTLLNTAARLTGKEVQQPHLFKALDDVNFSVEQGEVVGIIGHNGAGKSTLLKMLAEISTPTHGAVITNGRIAPLIEVGAGFVPDFTGRENVYLNGAILGMSKKEIDKKFDAIVDFAEMEDFIDTPVKRYSSGMQVKLAFAVATSVDADILIVDEVLAVGDVAFQRKCLSRMESFMASEGKTVLIVGHNIRQLERICSRMILLRHGCIEIDGEPSQVSKFFFDESTASSINSSRHERIFRPVIDTGEIEVRNLEILSTVERNGIKSITLFSDLQIQLDIYCSEPMQNLEIHIGLHNAEMVYVHKTSSLMLDHPVHLTQGMNLITITIPKIPISPGPYGIGLGIL